MTPNEEAVVFSCEGESLVGLLTRTAQPATLGVLIVVGGPQYRVGSHRQFVHLARYLATEGYAAFRFDCRGMGDSSGAMRSFEAVHQDIQAAIEAFRERDPTVTRIILFGLCDAASAILMTAGSLSDVCGLILANPWVRQEHLLNETLVRHYYRQRFLSTEFWRKFTSGRLPLLSASREFLVRLRMVSGRAAANSPRTTGSFVDQMLVGWQLPLRKLVLLSGQDLTAREFETLRATDRRWKIESASGLLEECALDEANHTFARKEWRDAMQVRCKEFLAAMS